MYEAYYSVFTVCEVFLTVIYLNTINVIFVFLVYKKIIKKDWKCHNP